MNGWQLVVYRLAACLDSIGFACEDFLDFKNPASECFGGIVHYLVSRLHRGEQLGLLAIELESLVALLMHQGPTLTGNAAVHLAFETDRVLT